MKKSFEKVTGSAVSNNTLPLQHVAIIMDGNRRWADLHKLPRLMGHREGVKSLKRLVRHVGELGLPYLTVYAFSSENWQRSPDEVNYLFELFGSVLKDELKELHESKVKLSFLGQLDKMPTGLRKSFDNAIETTANNKGLSLQVAINYGSRLEITEAVKEIANSIKSGALNPDQITTELLESHLYTKGMPDPELLIRTGGQMRLSNYLLWQAAYAEFYMTPTLWPDFSPASFDEAIVEFKQRERRFGGD